MVYNVARNPIGTVPDALPASDLGKELHPPILSTLAIHGFQVKRDRDKRCISPIKSKFVQKY